ncbi:TPA: hypothetical protein ACH3X1_003148 [Trebouxia sp. C0004]
METFASREATAAVSSTQALALSSTLRSLRASGTDMSQVNKHEEEDAQNQLHSLDEARLAPGPSDSCSRLTFERSACER